MVLSDVEALILRNQIALINSELDKLVGRIDTRANVIRTQLRIRYEATRAALGLGDAK